MQFLNPWFLIGVAAVAVPILIHLVQRERAQRVSFPSLMFVQRVMQPSTRRRRLRHLLLLAMRCLALTLLALAFSRPFISGDSGDRVAEGRHLVIALDTSYSMQVGNRFERALERARALINAADRRDQIGLIAFSDGYEIVQPLSSERDKILDALARLKPTLNATNYGPAVQAAGRMLAAAGQPKVVVIISDFQATGWDSADQVTPIAAQLMPIDVADAHDTNVAFVQVSVDPIVYASKYDKPLSVKLAAVGPQPQTVHVTLHLNDRPVDQKVVTLDANASATVQFSGFTLRDGFNRGVIEISGDAFALDNRYFFTIQKSEPLSIVCVESTPGASLYLEQAVLVSQPGGYTATIQSANNWTFVEPDKTPIVIVNDVDRLTDTAARQLARWVEQGGGLLLATGRRVQVATFNQSFGALAPATLHAEASSGPSHFEAITELETSHPLLAPFAPTRAVNLALVRIYAHHHAVPHAQAHVLARLSDGHPLLVEHAVGRGKVLLFTSSLDTSWNDLPLSPMYVPLMQQVLRHLRPINGPTSYRVGQAVRLPESASPMRLDSPSGKRVQTNVGLFLPEENGHYRLRALDGEQPIAVNLDFRESDLRKLDVNQFIAAFSSTNDVPPVQASNQSDTALPHDQEPGRRLWWLLLIVALTLLVMEAGLANRLAVSPAHTRRSDQHRFTLDVRANTGLRP